MIAQTQAFDDLQDNSESYIEPKCYSFQSFCFILKIVIKCTSSYIALLLHLVGDLYLYYALSLSYVHTYPPTFTCICNSAPLNIFIHTVCDNIIVSFRFVLMAFHSATNRSRIICPFRLNGEGVLYNRKGRFVLFHFIKTEQ